MVTEDFKRQLAGYGLTTARILYRRPDHRWLLQTYVWQDYDLCPDFPVLQGFLALVEPLVQLAVPEKVTWNTSSTCDPVSRARMPSDSHSGA